MQLRKDTAPIIVLLPASKIDVFGVKKKGIVTVFPHSLEILKAMYNVKKIDRVIFVNDAFLESWGRKETYRLSLGGYGSGKSYSKALEYLLLSMQPEYFRALFVRKNNVDIRDSQFLLLNDVIRAYQLEEYFDIHNGEMNITCKVTGHKLMAAGLSEVATLKGINDITHVWYEEPINKGRRGKRRRADITREDFETLNLRVRTEKAELHIDLTFNPISKSTWIYQDFIDPKTRKYELTTDLNDPKEAYVLKTTYKDNYFVSEKSMKDYERLTGDEATVGRDGDWANEKTGWEWVQKFDRAKHTAEKVVYLSNATIHASYDFNNLPYQTLLGIQVLRYFNKDKQKEVLQVRVFKEFCATPPNNTPKLATKMLIDEYLNRYGFNAVSVYGDCSGKFGVNNYLEIFDVLSRYMASDGDQVGNANPNRHTIREIINDILDEQYNIEILIDREKCPNLINDLENLQTDVKGFDPEKDEGIETKGHCYSAFAYFIAQYFEYLLKDR